MAKLIHFFKIVLSRIVSCVRFGIAFCLLAPLPLFLIYFNYQTDSSGILRGDLYLREVANMVLDGEDIVGYDLLNNAQRQITEILANEMNPLPDVLAFGSSRIMQLSTEVLNRDAQYGSFFNCAVTGGDMVDVLSSFYLFDKVDRLPSTIIIGFDPWLLRSGEDALDKRSNRELYAEFLTKKLDIPTDYTEVDTSEKWEVLFSLAYFQENITYRTRDSSGADKPVPVSGDLYEQTTEVKRGDGSLLYDVNFRTLPLAQRETYAWECANNLLRMVDYPAVDTSLYPVWKSFFSYVQSRDVKIVLVLTPFHPLVWDFAQDNPGTYTGFLQTEDAVRALADEFDIDVYGSYNPYAIEGVTEADFYDGLHCSAAAVEKILWGNATLPDHIIFSEDDLAILAEKQEETAE